MCRFGPFEVDFANSKLLKSGIPIHVQDQTLLILQALLEDPGEIVTREQLRERLWASQTFVDFERSLNAAVAKLRQVLSDSAERPLYIETVARKGYRFIAPVTRAVTQTAASTGELRPPNRLEVPKRRPYIWQLALVTVLILFSGGVLWLRTVRQSRTNEELGPIRFSFILPEGSRIAEPSFAPQMAISPDGRKIALVTSDSERTSISWRPLASETLIPVDGTEGARLPFWSPDSEEIGFFANGKLNIARLAGGPVRTMCETPAFFGASWNRNDFVLFSDGTTLQRVAVAGGTLTRVMKLSAAPTEVRQTWPQFLPDQMHFLYFEESIDSAKTGVFLASLDGSQRQMILANRTRGMFALPNDLLFVRDGTLFAQKLNGEHTRVQGAPVALANHVNTISAYGQAAFSVSAKGLVIYRTSENEAAAQLVLFNRQGKRIKSFGPIGPYTQVALSPDEKIAALNIKPPSDRPEAARIWLLRLDGDIISRLDFGGVANTDPVWSPDSQRIAFASFEAQGQRTKIFQWAMGDPSPTLLLDDGNSNKPDDWSPNGFLLCRRNDRTAFSLPLQKDGVPRDLGDNPFLKDELHLSPDGRMIAYNTWTTHYYTDQSDHPDVFVATFPEFGKTTQVSIDGGVQPAWGRGGRELYYLAINGTLMCIGIDNQRTIEPKTPKVLFRSSLQASQWRSQYSASADGQRFYVLEPVKPQQDILHVITQWSRGKPW